MIVCCQEWLLYFTLLLHVNMYFISSFIQSLFSLGVNGSQDLACPKKCFHDTLRYPSEKPLSPFQPQTAARQVYLFSQFAAKGQERCRSIFSRYKVFQNCVWRYCHFPSILGLHLIPFTGCLFGQSRWPPSRVGGSTRGYLPLWGIFFSPYSCFISEGITGVSLRL